MFETASCQSRLCNKYANPQRTHTVGTFLLCLCVCVLLHVYILPSCLSFCMHVSVKALTGVRLSALGRPCVWVRISRCDLLVCVCMDLSLHACACASLCVCLCTLSIQSRDDLL